MSEMNNEPQSSAVPTAIDNDKITCHLVRLPKIVLTRIDAGELPVPKKGSPLKKPLKRLGVKKDKTNLLSKTSVSIIPRDSSTGKRHRGRPKRLDDFISKLTNTVRKVSNTKVENTRKTNALKKPLKETSKLQNSVVKTMLKKTMLQKRSKIAIPPAKKTKLLPTKTNKPLIVKPKDQILPNINIPQAKFTDTDSSEDEFLYEELIDELQNTSAKHIVSVKPLVEKTTNITLKPNVGNKPPTIVKGGIIKKVNLPSDLKPITSTINLNFKEPKQNVETLKSKKKAGSTEKSTKLQNSLERKVSTKKASPWPVSILSPPKKSVDSTPNKSNKKAVSKLNASSTPNVINTPKIQPKPKASTKSLLTVPSKDDSIVISKPISLEMGKPKIGPKQMAKVVPLSKSQIQDDNLSDEYTEEETLENYDSEPADILTKPIEKPVSNNKLVQENAPSVKKTLKPNLSISENAKVDDPNLDLLRILTDDSDEQIPVQPIENKEKNKKPKTNSPVKENKLTNGTFSSSETLNPGPSTEALNETDEQPPVRTIYELVNEISLQYPSWNLHILPETSAFCIAQVTKGRLGIPTLKKCIELDPNDYNAKVYIHQYHIKKFDGVYDSEESIIALIQEIDSIKA